MSWFETVPSVVISNVAETDVPPPQPVHVPVITRSVRVVAPVTVRLSLIVTVPPAESRVRLDMRVVIVAPSSFRSESMVSSLVLISSGFKIR